MKKADKIIYKRDFEAMCQRLGATQVYPGTTDRPAEYRVDTVVGPLTFGLYDYIQGFGGSRSDPSTEPWVFGRFQYPMRASRIVDCNQFSGKWNFHQCRVSTIESMIESILSKT